MEQLWLEESRRFSNLSNDEKVRWLAKLAFLVTILARECYVPGGDSLTEPKKMRRYNEIAHRICTQLLHVAQSDEMRMPDDIFFEMISEELTFLDADMKYVIKKLQ